MNVLAEAHSKSPGRYVLMPPKGYRFRDPHEWTRMRARRRRRQLFMFLLDATLILGLMGFVPRLHVMWYGAIACGLMLSMYTLALVRINVLERDRARLRQRMLREDAQPAYATNGNGNGHRTPLSDYGYEFEPPQQTQWWDEQALREGGVEILDDDVHVIIRKGDRAKEPVASAIG